MPKYTEEQLLEAREIAYIPKPEILDAFSKLVESVKEHVANERKVKLASGDSYIDEHGNERSYSRFNRRRSSRSGTSKPNLRKKSEVDEHGWATLVKPRKSFGADEAADERHQFKESLKESTIKVKPNNKNLGSSKAVDPRDTIADKQTTTFNAFEALGDGDDDA